MAEVTCYEKVFAMRYVGLPLTKSCKRIEAPTLQRRYCERANMTEKLKEKEFHNKNT